MKNNDFEKKEIVEVSQDDFEFVQLDKTIHDTKFESKPTTYFKDAMRRFRKNKASVTAGYLIGILVLLAIFVPIFNQNDISSGNQTAYAFLPPRILPINSLGFLDGTKKYEDIVLDMSDPENPTPVGSFNKDYITSEIEITESHSNTTASPYGWGGVVNLSTDSTKGDVTFTSPTTFVDINNDYEIKIDLSKYQDEYVVDANYQVYASVYYEDVSTKVVLKDYSSDLGEITIDNLTSLIKENIPEGNNETSFKTSLSITLKTNPSGTSIEKNFPKLFISSFVVNNTKDANDETFKAINFTEGNEVMYREIAHAENAWDLAGYGSATLYKGVLARGSFRYDRYSDVFGEVTKVVDDDTMDKYIANGWCSYDYNVGVESFKILDDKCPVRSVEKQVTNSVAGITYTELTCVVSRYRESGYSSMPIYIFGTNNSGYDYFKVLFSGLGVSLLLGLLVSIICIVFGIIWGAISGYYGGAVDLAMERIVEVLGGIPFIVIITLCVLHLGQTFGVFLLAMCMTGWIGVSSGTRSQFYRYKGREYVLASRTLGARDFRLIFKHILPNSIGPLVTSAVLMIPSVIFSEATVSYLGLGFKELNSFGTALSKAQQYISDAPYLIISGSIIVSILMISFNLLGNGLRDAFNPSLKGVE